MSQRVPDYSNTSIYKLCCKDPSITDIYVGHTTNFKNRKWRHKSSCNTENGRDYSIYVYEFIRDHGGFENWDMIEICNVNCLDKRAAERCERDYIESLGASLNRIIPTRTHKEYYVDNKESILEEKKEYYLDNRDTILEDRKEYYIANKESISIRKKKYDAEHRAENSERHKKWRDTNKEHCNEKYRQYYEKNKERKKIIDKKYREDNKKKIREYQREYKLKKKAEKLAKNI